MKPSFYEAAQKFFAEKCPSFSTFYLALEDKSKPTFYTGKGELLLSDGFLIKNITFVDDNQFMLKQKKLSENCWFLDFGFDYRDCPGLIELFDGFVKKFHGIKYQFYRNFSYELRDKILVIIEADGFRIEVTMVMEKNLNAKQNPIRWCSARWIDGEYFITYPAISYGSGKISSSFWDEFSSVNPGCKQDPRFKAIVEEMVENSSFVNYRSNDVVCISSVDAKFVYCQFDFAQIHLVFCDDGDFDSSNMVLLEQDLVDKVIEKLPSAKGCKMFAMPGAGIFNPQLYIVP